MKYRKKPVVIEAIQWDGENEPEIISFLGGSFKPCDNPDYLSIQTRYGLIVADLGDWIIKDPLGAFSICNQTVFEKTYEPA